MEFVMLSEAKHLSFVGPTFQSVSSGDSSVAFGDLRMTE